MRNPPRSILALVFPLALTLLCAAPLAADLAPAGPETRLAAVDLGAACPAAAALPDGSFLMVWSPAQGEGSFTCSPAGRVLARRLDRDGRPLGPPFLVGRTGDRCVGSLQVGFPAADGAVAVSWTSAEGKLGDVRLVVARVGPGNQVTRVLDELAFAVAHLRSGALLLFSRPDGSTGIGRGPVAQRWNASGTPGGPLFDVLPARQEFDPSTFAAAEVSPGAVAVVWGRPNGRLFGRKLRTDGTDTGLFFTLSDPVAIHPRIAGNGRGRFAVIWDGRDSDVLGQVFGPGAAPVAGPFRVNTRPDGQQAGSSIQMTADGRLAVAWHSLRRTQQGVNAVGRLFAPNGQGLGQAVQLPSDPAGPQFCGRLTADTAGSRWLATWLGEGPDGMGLYGRVLVDEP